MCSTIGNGYWPIDVTIVAVALDEAAELSSPVFGGPLVLLAPHGPVRRSFGEPLPFTDAWTVWIRAFILEEALDALHELQDVLPGSDIREVFAPTRWRFRDGELVPLETWEWPAWGAAALANVPPFSPDEDLTDREAGCFETLMQLRRERKASRRRLEPGTRSASGSAPPTGPRAALRRTRSLLRR